MRAGGPASESPQGRKPRVGEALAARGARLWGFGDRSSRGGWCRQRCFASDGSGGSARDWRINVEWRFGGAKGREIGRGGRVRRECGGAGERCRRRAIVDEDGDRSGG